VLNFDDGFTELLRDKRCSIIHLHGSVDRPNSGYVFSQREYAKLMVRPNSWMLTLSQLIRTDTFVVAGTSFDEIDVEYYLEQRSQKTIRGDVPPSILIEPFPDRLTESLCMNHEFCLFKGTVHQFFAELEELDSRISKPWVDNENDGLAGLGLADAARLRFSASFDVVPDEPAPIPNPARFLLGSELNWSMLGANTDIPRDVFSEVRKQILDTLTNPNIHLFLLIDEAGSGKTAFLKRLAFDLSRGTDVVFWYSGFGFELEVSEIANMLNSVGGRLIVFFDNFADNLNSVALILKNITKGDVLFVCAERDYRLTYIENSFTGHNYHQVKDVLNLTTKEARALRAVHEEHGLSTIKSTPDHAYLLQVVGKTISEATCRIQNNFKTLDNIVQDLATECDRDEIFAYLLVSLARYCYSTGVRRHVLSTISFPDAIEHLLSDSSSLPLKYSDHDASFVVPRQAIIGDRMLEIKKKHSGKELLRAFCELAAGVAPRVNPETIKRKTPEAQILGRLMDYDNNVKRFIDDHAKEYYTALKPLCDWNARYWEQMSLLKLERFFASPDDRLLLDESIQHARSAISAQVHPFSLTTLAKVLFQAMEKSPANRDEYFGEVWDSISEANRRESRWSNRGATVFVVCFGGVLSYLTMGGQLSGEQYEFLRDMVSESHSLKIRDKWLFSLRKRLADEL